MSWNLFWLKGLIKIQYYEITVAEDMVGPACLVYSRQNHGSYYKSTGQTWSHLSPNISIYKSLKIFSDTSRWVWQWRVYVNQCRDWKNYSCTSFSFPRFCWGKRCMKSSWGLFYLKSTMDQTRDWWTTCMQTAGFLSSCILYSQISPFSWLLSIQEVPIQQITSA